MDCNLTEQCFTGMAGAYAAMFTPFDGKGRVDPEAVARIMDYGYGNGLRGFYLTGSTGEWWMLDVEERKAIYRAAAKANRGRGKLIAHVGANRTDDAVALARAAADAGIDWVSALPPQLYRNSFDAAMLHYGKIASATDLPLMIYSLRAEIVPDRDVRLFDIENVKGIKYTGSDYYSVQRLKRRVGKETIWFAGRDEQLVCALALGNVFSGGIGTTYNIIPRHFAEICRLASEGKFPEAAKWQDEANQVVELMIESDNWEYRKKMMAFVGVDIGSGRTPVEEPVPSEKMNDFLARFAALGAAKRNQAH